jgi:hypothetical protein
MKNIDLKSYDVYRPTKAALAGIRKAAPISSAGTSSH